MLFLFFFFSSRRRHTRYIGDWSSDVCSSDLAQVERAEAYLRQLGVTGDLRVRHHGDRGGARIEVEPRWVPWVTERLPAIKERLTALGFAVVEVDPRGYRRGGLLAERAERA